MAGIIPLPNSRISGLLARQRLTTQLQADQLDVFRLQEQISTGRRITLPSEDAPAALRAMSLQRLLERKSQIRSNVNTGQSYLDASWKALDDVASTLGDLKGQAIGAASTTSTASDRQTLVDAIDNAISNFVNVGNTTFRGRYLYSGNQTNVQPYSVIGDAVLYSGNDRAVRNYSDVGILFDSNISGQDVFGGVSEQVLGGVDLSPQVTADTKLSSLNGGAGVSPNAAISISDGTHTSIVDLSKATTLGDVARLIEENPPAGRELTVSITGNGLSIDIDDAGGGNLSVTEVASGRAASELGILNPTGALTGPLVGADVNPVIERTTRLADLLGTKAFARLSPSGPNNDISIAAAVNGAAYNGATIQIVDDSLRSLTPGIAAGNEYAQYDANARAATAAVRFAGVGDDLQLTAVNAGTDYNNVSVVVAGATGIGPGANASYDSLNKRLTITVDSAGTSTIDDVRAAINGTGVFTAAGETGFNPAATVSSTNIGATTGNTGNTGGAAKTLYVYVEAGKSTANQVAAAINAQGTFTASIDSRDSSNLSSAGTGIVPVTTAAVTAGGSGQDFDKTHGIRVVNSGVATVVNFNSAETVDDLLNALNGSDANLQAEINDDGSGINIRSRLSGGTFQIGENGGQTATQLGVRSFTGATKLSDLNDGIGVATKYDSFIEPPALPTTLVDFTIWADNGLGVTANLNVDLTSATTVQDVLDAVNNHAGNHVGGISVTARLAANGNGIEIVDDNARPLTLESGFGSSAAEHLGLLSPGQTSATSATGTISGTDQNYLRNDSVFTTLVQLREAVKSNDVEAMHRAIDKMDADLDRASFARSEVGARQQALDLSKTHLEDEDVQLQSALSGEIDVDLVQAINELVSRQAALQASLQTTANILQLSLLSFL